MKTLWNKINTLYYTDDNPPVRLVPENPETLDSVKENLRNLLTPRTRGE